MQKETTKDDGLTSSPNDSNALVVCSAFNTRNKIAINNADDFSDVASDILTDFLEGFTVENGLIRPITEADKEEIDCEYIYFLYTDKGTALAERMIKRLSKVGAKYFDELDIEIKSGLYVEG